MIKLRTVHHQASNNEGICKG